MSLTLEQTIEQCERFAKVCEYHNLTETQEEIEQLVAWLKILKSAKFEYNEAWRILTHPTPDVRYPDIDRAKMILDVFRDSLGRMD